MTENNKNIKENHNYNDYEYGTNKHLSDLINSLQDVIYNIYIQNYYIASITFKKILPQIITIEEIKADMADPYSNICNIIQSIMDAMERADMILLSDLIKEGMIPHLQSLLEIKEGVTTKDYSIEMTSSGNYTIKDLKSGIYLHSNSNPMEEAGMFIRNYLDTSKSKFIVWGLGLGYHIIKLLDETNNAIDIEVYYDNSNLLQIAREYGVIKGDNKKIKYYYDHEGSNFIKAIDDKEAAIIIHYPSLKAIRNESFKNSMEKLYMGWNGTKQFKKDFEINFRSNQRIIQKNVDTIIPKLKDKEVYLVAAGPSLDSCIDILNNRDENSLIMTVTTIYRKLCELNIVPDYTVIMDSQEVTLRQVEDLENQSVPMIIGSTTYWEIADRYQGEKYISYQKDYSLSEEAAAKEGVNIYPTGGSVTTLALSILLKAGVKQINLIGADLAYLDGRSHAGNVRESRTGDIAVFDKIKSVTGGIVYTEKKLHSYLRWIEREIIKYPEIKVYNYSKTGAWISGTYNPYTGNRYL